MPTFTLLTTLQSSMVPAMSTLQLFANSPPPPCRVPVGSNRTPAKVRYARSDERTEAPAWMLTSASAAWTAPPPESVAFAVSCVSQSTMDDPLIMVNDPLAFTRNAPAVPELYQLRMVVPAESTTWEFVPVASTTR